MRLLLDALGGDLIGTFETDRHDKTAKLRDVFGLKLHATQHLRIAQPATARWVEFVMGQPGGPV